MLWPANMSKRPTPKKLTQNPSSTIEHLKAISEPKSDAKRPIVFKKKKVAPSSDETYMPQAKKVKPTQEAPPPPPPPLTQPRTSK